jgi:hypothetical protein
MPISTFVDDPEPTDPRASIWRYIEFWKLQDLLQTREIYFRRSDKLNDEHEGLPPSEYERVLNLRLLASAHRRNCGDVDAIREGWHCNRFAI